MSKIVPVIHTINWKQVKYNLDICHNNGVDFVFLINHGGKKPVDSLIENFYQTRELYPDMKVGLNFLQLTTVESFKVSNTLNPDAVWSDVSFITPDDLTIANEIESERKGLTYFGSVAFKYQKQPASDQLEEICLTAKNYMNVITTSGPATGTPASEVKIANMRKYIGNHPLAIASGVDINNKSMFAKYVDYMLVASSITDARTEIIVEQKLKDLLKC